MIIYFSDLDISANIHKCKINIRQVFIRNYALFYFFTSRNLNWKGICFHVSTWNNVVIDVLYSENNLGAVFWKLSYLNISLVLVLKENCYSENSHLKGILSLPAHTSTNWVLISALRYFFDHEACNAQ